MEVNVAEARRKRRERGRKVRYLAREWGITPRAVYMRIQKDEINLDEVQVPENWEALQELPSEGEGSADEAEGILEEAIHTSVHDSREWKELISEQISKIGELHQQIGELRERNQWLFAENTFLKKEIGLLKAPPEVSVNPTEAEKEAQEAEAERVKRLKVPSLLDRIRFAWYGFAKGGLQEQIEN